MSRILIVLGIALILLGILWPLLKKIGIGHLPGDIVIKHDNFSFYFPVMTCIIVSVVLTIVMWLLNR